MKKILSFLGAALLSLLLALPGQAKTLRLALDAEPQRLDYMSELTNNQLAFAEWVFDPLVRWTKDMKLELRLAEKIEQKDPLTLRITLRKGVFFHSGNPLTAADVQWTFERARKSPDWTALFEPFREAVVLDEHTLDFTFTRPEPMAVNVLTYIFPMDSKFYTGQDPLGKDKGLVSLTEPVFANANASGTGPFTVVSFEPQMRLVLERNPRWWDKAGKGNVRRVVVTPIKNAGSRTAALLSGSVDCINPVNPQDQEIIAKDPALTLRNLTSNRVITMGFNPDAQPAFKDLRVRQAVVAAINNAAIVDKVMNRLTVPAEQFSAKGMSGYNPRLKSRFDLEKARKLMQEAGYGQGFSVSIIAPNNRYTNDEKIAEAVVAMLEKINIKAELKTMPVSQYWPEFKKRKAGLQMVGWIPDTEDSANYFEFLLYCDNKEKGWGAYSSGYCNPQIDQQVQSAALELDAKKRSQILRDAEKMAYDDAAFIPLHYEPLSWAARKNVNLDTCINHQNLLYLGDMVIE